jgi:corrinoid protein of di/trimethylamine methyltransferase
MITEDRKNDILKGLHDAVVSYNKEKATEWSKTALAEGLNAYEAIMNGLTAGMETVGKLFDSEEYYVPEVLLCSDALYLGLDILKPHVKEGEIKVKGHVVIGTVEGDIHDIGKTLVKLMLELSGFTVHDLGRDVKLQRFVEEQKRTNSDIVALSALMTTTMMAMPEVIGMIREHDKDVKIMVGGAPLSREVADRFGADGYADNAAKAVTEAIKLTGGR